MGWSETLAYDHVRRLVKAGYVRRVPMTRADGSLTLITPDGAAKAGYPASRAPRSIGPTTWLHATACAWTSAWLVLRLRALRQQASDIPSERLEWWGERDIGADNFWRRQVRSQDHRGTGRFTHRPDLGVRLGGLPMPVEVELQRKSRARLRGILGMYEELSSAGEARFGGVIYVTGAPDIDTASRAPRRTSASPSASSRPVPTPTSSRTPEPKRRLASRGTPLRTADPEMRAAQNGNSHGTPDEQIR